MAALAEGKDPGGTVDLGVWNRGRWRGDMLWAGGGMFVPVSDRAVEVLTAIKATGWRAHPARTRFANGEELPGYHILIVTGSCGDFFARAREEPRNQRRGVDLSYGWDGSDVFWIDARQQFTFCVTDRVRQAFDAAGLTRITYEDPADYELEDDEDD